MIDDETEITTGEKKGGAWRAFAWTLLIVALPLSLGWLVARGDIDLGPALSSLHRAVTPVDEPASASPAVADGPELKALLDRISDLETRISLDAALRDEPRLEGLDLRVEVAQGAVRLSGSAATPEQKEVAERIAAAQVGEDRLTSRLAVGAGTADARPQLARRIEFELFTAEAFDLGAIDVTSEGGVVTLQGSVRAQAERLLAERLAEDVAGVSEVVNELVLAPPESAPSTRGPLSSENDGTPEEEIRQGV